MAWSAVFGRGSSRGARMAGRGPARFVGAASRTVGPSRSSRIRPTPARTSLDDFIRAGSWMLKGPSGRGRWNDRDRSGRSSSRAIIRPTSAGKPFWPTSNAWPPTIRGAERVLPERARPSSRASCSADRAGARWWSGIHRAKPCMTAATPVRITARGLGVGRSWPRSSTRRSRSAC